MNTRYRTAPLVMAALAGALACARPQAIRESRPNEPPRTRAERSAFRETSSSGDVKEFLDAVARASSRVVVTSLGESGEGKPIPTAIVADPPLTSPDADALGDRMVVAMIGNIHAGEVDGKEALLALVRDLAAAPDPGVLKHLVVCVIPNYNPDGNDRFSTEHRKDQGGPPSVGTRENGAGLDLNRDFVKADAPETRALLRFFRKWDPAVFVDAHTTNGSLHRNLITYASPKHPAGDAAIADYVRTRFLPQIGARLAKQQISTGPYGFFGANRTEWVTFPDDPRFGTNYYGLRNRVSLLCESYSYAPFEERVRGSYAFLRESLELAAAERANIAALEAKADQGAGRRTVALRTGVRAYRDKIKVPGFREGDGPDRMLPAEYELSLIDDFEPVKSVAPPDAYYFSEKYAAAAEALQRHGVAVEVVRERAEVASVVYRVERAAADPNEYQHHHLLELTVAPRSAALRVEAGGFLVRTRQPLGALAVYLLEPESHDGLAAWGFFGEGAAGDDYPCARIDGGAPLLSTAARPPAEDREPPRLIRWSTLHGAAPAPSFAGGTSGIDRWLDDGEHYLQRKAGRLWKVDALTGRAEPFGDEDAELVKAMRAASPPAADTLERIGMRGVTWNADRSAFFFTDRLDLYYCRVDGKGACRLTNTPDEAEEIPEFSPDGSKIAFVRGNNLMIVDSATRKETALTSGGNDRLRYGKADWVYFEELFNRSWKAYWWSPDGRSIALLRSDCARVPTYTIVDDMQKNIIVEPTAYPRVQEPNPAVDVQWIDVATGAARTVDLSEYPIDDRLVTAVGWWGDSKSIYICVQDRVQTRLDLLACDASGAKPSRLLRDSTGAWIESPTLEFLADGSFLMTSERSGYQHLYHYERGGKLIRAVTSGAWEIRSVEHVDEARGWVYFTGMRDDPMGAQLYRARLADGRIERLTREAGTHAVKVSPKGGLFVTTWSDRMQPARTQLCACDGGAVVRTLDTNPVFAFDDYRFGTEEQLLIPTPDGEVIQGSLLRPADFDPKKKYPVWFKTYGGPHSPTLIHRFDSDRAWAEALVNEGFLVFRADPRSAGGRGAVSAWRCYKQLGVSELEDIGIAVRWLLQHEPAADASRVGMEGHSYGGYLTAYAMTHGDLFAAGIAGAPVTDWRLYDSIYTERYMLLPQQNAAGYERSSVLNAAKSLRGRLLLLHGMVDDNVHPQNSTMLIRALQTANVSFDLMMYPGSRHGVSGEHYQQLKRDFILRTLGRPTSTAP